MAGASVLASGSLSLRLEHEAVAVARGCDLAAAVDTAASRLNDSVARAGLAAGAMLLARRTAPIPGPGGPGLPDRGAGGPGAAASATGQGGPADAGAVASADGSAGPGDYRRAEAEATRQLDALDMLALEPGLEWLGVPLAGVRDAVLSRMAAMDGALRDAGGAGRPAGDAGAAALDDDTAPLVAALVGQVDDRRHDLVARSLAAASLDRRRLVAAEVVGAVLLSALALATPRRRPGAGAFATELPSTAAEPAGAGLVEAPDPDAGAGPASGQAAPALRVLLAEDNDMVRFSLEAMLSDLGYAVVAAGNAADAIDLAGTGPDVLVTDLGLPDMDGLALARHLRALHPLLRVVVASGHPGSAPDAVWLQKPFDLDRLRRAVEASAPSPV